MFYVTSLKDVDEMRNRLGIRQKDLCQRAGVTASALIRCRKDDREPRVRTLQALMAAMESIAEERGVRLVEASDGQ